MTVRHFILATAGHVDHGKSALVKALTGTDPDRLPEEKARGITIDLGFAELLLASPKQANPPAQYQLGIVDVPGHEDFVKNMVAGVGSIDVALLVVAADDGWMPQTEEHFQILNHLGVKRGVVALTKIDLVHDEQLVIGAVREKLEGTPLAKMPIIPTSVVSGRGITDVKTALAGILSTVPPHADIAKPRLSVDRAFSLKGIGTVVTGTLSGGAMKRGQSVVVQPSGSVARLRTLQTHSREIEVGWPGSRVALNLPDLQVDREHTHGPSMVGRGDVVTLADLGGASNTLDVLLVCSDRAEASPLVKDGLQVHLHHGSGDFAAKVSLLGIKELRPGQCALAQLRLDRPIFAFTGDRFVVRDWPAQHTLCGGSVLDADAKRKGFRSAGREMFLGAIARSVEDPAAYASALLERDGVIHLAVAFQKTLFSRQVTEHVVQDLLERGTGVIVGTVLVKHARWQELKEQLVKSIDAYHAAHPEQLGPKLADLRGTMEKGLPVAGAFDALVVELCKAGFVRSGAQIRRMTHRAALPQRLAAAGERIRKTLAAKPMEPPSRKELAGDAVAQQALRFLLETGEAVAVGEELALAAEAYSSALEQIVISLKKRGSATVSDLRQLLGTTRRVILPLLEKLDREGITVRNGDLRSLGKRA